MNIEMPEIPDAYIELANLLATACDERGISKATLTIVPETFDALRRTTAKVEIYFSSRDGRGRPCRNLSVALDTTIRQQIETTPPSINR